MATKSLSSLSDLPPEVPLSYLLDNAFQPETSVVTASASAALKRGRGRPPKPKPKPDFHQNGQFPTNRNNNVPVPVVSVESPHAKRPRGRPRKDGGLAPTAFQAAPVAVKQRGRPPGWRGTGRPRKFKPVSSLERVTPIVVNGPRKRGRPRKCDVWATAVPASVEIGEAARAVARAKKRGRPPQVISSTGRTRGRPRKDAAHTVAEVPREGPADYGALKRRYDFLQEKVMEAANKLKAAVSAMEEVQLIAAVMNSG